MEARIDKDQYLRLLMDADPTLTPIRKNRYYILQRKTGRYLELDVFPGCTEKALLEIELSEADAGLQDLAGQLPSFIHIIKEVTDDPFYKNHEIARRGGRL